MSYNPSLFTNERWNEYSYFKKWILRIGGESYPPDDFFLYRASPGRFADLFPLGR